MFPCEWEKEEWDGPQWGLESWAQYIWDDVSRRHRGVDVKLSDKVVYNMQHHAMESAPINESAYASVRNGGRCGRVGAA